MDNHCITCKFCDHSDGHICTLGILPIDDPYSDSCSNYTSEEAQPFVIGADLALPQERIQEVLSDD